MKIAVYRVRRPFTYNGKLLEKDSIFPDGGGKYDDQLKEGPLLYRTEVTESEYIQMQAETVKETKTAPKKTTRRRRSKK